MFNYKEILEKGKIILRAINNKGYKAWISEESVINVVMGIDSKTLSLSTNAPLEDVKMLFNGYNTYNINDYSFLIDYDNIQFVIIHLNKYDSKGDRVLCFDLEEYLLSRSFTVKALAMGLDGKITDYVDGYKDIQNRCLRLNKGINKRLKEDPAIILEGLKLASFFGFNVTLSAASQIKRSKAIRKLEYSELVDSLTSALRSKNKKQVLKYVSKTKIYKYIDILGEEFKHQIKKKQRVDSDTFIQMALVRAKMNGNYNEANYEICLNETTDKDRSERIVELALKSRDGQYTKLDLFNYGLNISLVSNNINYLLGITPRKDKKIKKEYGDLCIKSNADIRYFEEDIIKDFKEISVAGIYDVLEKVKEAILEGKLLNDYYEIKEFVSQYAYNERNFINSTKKVEEKEETVNNDEEIFKLKEELKRKEEIIQELEENNLLEELEKESDRIARSIVKDLNIYKDEKDKVYNELKEAYRNILIKNTQKYERLK